MGWLPLSKISAVALLVGTSCGTVSAAFPDPSAAGSDALTVHDSCGTSFTVRDSAGTTRLSIRPGFDTSNEVLPGTYDIGTDAPGSGTLEIGSGLDVWPCHDIMSDFDGEKVNETWSAVSGSFELLEPIAPDESGGGGSGAVLVVLKRVEFKSPDGETVVFEEVELQNSRWGFYGG